MAKQHRPTDPATGCATSPWLSFAMHGSKELNESWFVVANLTWGGLPMLRRLAAATLALFLISTLPAAAADPAVLETVIPQFTQAIPNIPGKTLTVVVVDYPPGAKSVPHRHAPSAFIYAYVLSGAVRSQVDDAPVRIHRAGEDWMAPPGAHHTVSENASTTEPARLLAVFVVKNGETLTIPDQP